MEISTIDQAHKVIEHQEHVIRKLVQGEMVVQIMSDHWVKRQEDGTYKEMTAEEQLEYSK